MTGYDPLSVDLVPPLTGTWPAVAASPHQESLESLLSSCLPIATKSGGKVPCVVVEQAQSSLTPWLGLIGSLVASVVAIVIAAVNAQRDTAQRLQDRQDDDKRRADDRAHAERLAAAAREYDREQRLADRLRDDELRTADTQARTEERAVLEDARVWSDARKIVITYELDREGRNVMRVTNASNEPILNVRVVGGYVGVGVTRVGEWIATNESLGTQIAQAILPMEHHDFPGQWSQGATKLPGTPNKFGRIEWDDSAGNAWERNGSFDPGRRDITSDSDWLLDQ